jgi:hypothetical protein
VEATEDIAKAYKNSLSFRFFGKDYDKLRGNRSKTAFALKV